MTGDLGPSATASGVRHAGARSRPPRGLRRTAGALGLVVLGLAAVEVAARLLAPRQGPVPVDFLEPGRDGGFHGLARGVDRMFQVEGRSVRVRTGPSGRVGALLPGAEHRIAVVGDSRAMGLWASDYSRSMVGAAAAALAPRGVGVENWAVPGYGLVEVESRLDEVLGESPDVVVLVTSCADDLAETWLATHGAGPPVRRVRGGRLPPDRRGRALPLDVRYGCGLRGWARAEAWLCRVSVGYRLFREGSGCERAGPVGSLAFGAPGFWCRTDGGPFAAEAERAAAEVLQRMQRACGERGTRFAVVAVPAREQVRAAAPSGDGWDVRVPQACLLDAAAATGAATLDLLPALRAAREDGGEPLYFEQDPNLTDAGHAACARELVPFLGAFAPDGRSARR